MDLENLSKEIAKSLSLSDHLEVLSELFILQCEKDLKDISRSKLKTYIAKKLHLNVAFNEINESRSFQSENDSEDLVSIIDSKSDHNTAESIILDAIQSAESEIQKEQSRPENIKIINRSCLNMTARQEDIYYLRHVLRYSCVAIAKLIGVCRAEVYRELKRIDDMNETQNISSAAIIEMEDI